MITSENVVITPQFKNYFVSWNSHVPDLRY